jgi:hypothetical protein
MGTLAVVDPCGVLYVAGRPAGNVDTVPSVVKPDDHLFLGKLNYAFEIYDVGRLLSQERYEHSFPPDGTE